MCVSYGPVLLLKSALFSSEVIYSTGLLLLRVVYHFCKANVMSHDIFYELPFFSPISDAARTIDQDIGGPLIQGSD